MDVAFCPVTLILDGYTLRIIPLSKWSSTVVITCCNPWTIHLYSFGGVLKCGYPQNIDINRNFHSKQCILGTPIYGNPHSYVLYSTLIWGDTHRREPPKVPKPASSLRFRWIFTELVVVTLALLATKKGKQKWGPGATQAWIFEYSILAYFGIPYYTIFIPYTRWIYDHLW